MIPASEGRGYVLRRIIRRALRHGHKLGQTKPFFHRLVPDLVQEMGAAYPELKEAAARVEQALKLEEERFGETLENGMKILEAALAKDPAYLDGETAFTLYDTYGFPLDLTADICRERDVTLDEAGFEAAMSHQKSTARAAGKFEMATSVEYSGPKTRFVGYDALQLEGEVLALYVDGAPVEKVEAGQEAIVVLDSTPFYAESGGQAGDIGTLESEAGEFRVQDTRKLQPDVHRPSRRAGVRHAGGRRRAQCPRRCPPPRADHAQPLCHAPDARGPARTCLGGHVSQKGSLVDADKTRFDFSHNAPLTQDEIRRVEAIVNHEILENHPTEAQHMAYDEAISHGAMALFGEKYGDEVRVLGIGSSRELCGGTHVTRTGDIGLFKIVSEGGVASGIRRVEAVTGENALALVQKLSTQVNEAAAALKAQPDELGARIQQVQDQVRQLERELNAMKSKAAASKGDELVGQAVDINGHEGAGGNAGRRRRGVAAQHDGQAQGQAEVGGHRAGGGQRRQGHADRRRHGGRHLAQVKAGELVNFVAQQVGGKGGGRPDMAQAGGTDPSGLPRALDGVADWVRGRA